VLIVCEGRETEPNYFHGLRREEYARRHFSIRIKRGKGGTRLEIAQFAVDQKNRALDDYDEVWCVMDVESPKTRDDMRQALDLLKRTNIKSALSNPAIEVWFLAHFEKTGAVFLNCDAVQTRLDAHWQKHFRTAYEKADQRVYQRLAQLTDQAIDNAQWVREHHHAGKDVIDGNSSTEVDLLVGKLRG
jgi:hypothetical protein